MVRISRLAGLAFTLAVAFGAQADQGRVRGATHHHAHSAPLRAPVFVSPVVAAYGYSYGYGSSNGYASRPLAAPHATALYYVGPIAANAPPFHIDNAARADQPSWNWERVNLQQLAAEVRARRASATDAPPANRKYCPDSRAYYPDVTQCASEWLTVVGKAPAAARPKSPAPSAS